MLKLSGQKFETDFISYLDYEYHNLYSSRSWMRILKLIVGAWLAKVNMSKDVNSHFLFFKSMQRKDYDNLFLAVYEACDHEKICLNLNYKYSLNGLKEALKGCRDIEMEELSKLPFLKRFFIFSSLVRYQKLLVAVRDWTCKVLVVFADMHPEDNLLVQYFKYRGAITCTLQHGLYVDYKDSPNINVTNYRNVVSNYFLSWGEETKQLIKQYHNDVLVAICGKPTEYNVPAPTKDPVFTVIFDQKIFLEYNKKLLSIALEIANNLKIKVHLKIHPLDEKGNYDLDEKLVSTDGQIERSKFILAHTTSLMYELIRAGYAVYKLASDVPSNKTDSSIIFSDAKELLEKMDEIYPSKGDFYIKFIGEKSKEQYTNFFSKIV